MALSIVVSPGIVLPNNRPLTVADLQLLGLPAVSIAGAVGGSDVAPGGIDATHVKPGGVFVGTATGTTALVVTLVPAPTAHAAGVWCWVVPAATNVGAVTLTINALPVRPLVRVDGTECLPGDLVAGRPALVAYDASLAKYILLNPARPGGLVATAGGAADALTLTLPITGVTLASLVGVPFWCRVTQTNFGPATLAVNGTADIAIRTTDGRALYAGELLAETYVLLVYDGTYYRMIAGGQTNAVAMGTAGGTADALTLTLPLTGSTLASLVGRPFWCKLTLTNTGAATLAVNGTAATAIRSPEGRPLYAGELLADAYVLLVYDGTYYRLVAGGQTTTTASQSGTTVDWALARNQYRTLDAHLTVAAFANAEEGREVTLWITQAASGGYNVSWDAGLGIKWEGASAPTMVGTANRTNAYHFIKINGVIYGHDVRNYG